MRFRTLRPARLQTYRHGRLSCSRLVRSAADLSDRSRVHRRRTYEAKLQNLLALVPVYAQSSTTAGNEGVKDILRYHG